MPELHSNRRLDLPRAGRSRRFSMDPDAFARMSERVARFLGTDDALAFVSGHATNISVIGHLLGRDDLVICDALSHNSIFEGIKLAGSTRLVFPHNDLEALNGLLNEHRARYANVLVVVEGLYSMDGDCPNLQRLIEMKRAARCWLMVDEAHSVAPWTCQWSITKLPLIHKRAPSSVTV